jgi:invasion protein IalB
MNKMLKSVAVLATVLLIAGPASAQEQSTNRVFAETDWSVFVEDNPTQCWIVSSAKESVNTKGGRVVAVNRGDTLMFVSFWPGAGKLGEVSFTGGYPYGDGATVSIEIGANKFEMFTTGENAWAASAEEDNKIISAMRRGAEAVVTGVSSRGTKTQDTISLRGFTKALDDATKRCS